jgi:tRNA pseudouridine55 synthase
MTDYKTFTADDFLAGKLLLIDKPFGWTSFDAVKKVHYTIRKAFGLKKIKVGHAGTLDPLATGLLIICTGKFTKKIAELTLEDKTYTGTFTIGATTPSYDLESEVENHMPTAHITLEMVKDAAKKMSGVQMQMPPQFSAKQVDGKRAYESARKGIEVKLEPKEVNISRFEVDATSLPEVHFEITCSKGTYIRSMARDLGEILGCGAHLTKLVRTKVGAFELKDAVSPEAFQANLED